MFDRRTGASMISLSEFRPSLGEPAEPSGTFSIAVMTRGGIEQGCLNTHSDGECPRALAAGVALALVSRLPMHGVSTMVANETNLPRSVVFSNADRCAQAIVDRVGYDLRLAVPVSIGKPILIVDALYRLAEADRRVQLTIFTGLTLTLPRPRSSLEASVRRAAS